MDLTNHLQHGFKRKCSTSTLMAVLQSQIARALEDEDFVIVVSLYLSSAFDLVDTNLRIKRLKMVGLQDDVIRLIEAWLENRSFYVSKLYTVGPTSWNSTRIHTQTSSLCYFCLTLV
jgi:hypothetical protein